MKKEERAIPLVGHNSTTLLFFVFCLSFSLRGREKERESKKKRDSQHFPTLHTDRHCGEEGKKIHAHCRELAGSYHSGIYYACISELPSHPTTHLLIHFRLSSDAEILLMITDWAYKSMPNVQKPVCNVYVFQLSFHFACHRWWLGAPRPWKKRSRGGRRSVNRFFPPCSCCRLTLPSCTNVHLKVHCELQLQVGERNLACTTHSKCICVANNKKRPGREKGHKRYKIILFFLFSNVGKDLMRRRRRKRRKRRRRKRRRKRRRRKLFPCVHSTNWDFSFLPFRPSIFSPERKENRRVEESLKTNPEILREICGQKLSENGFAPFFFDLGRSISILGFRTRKRLQFCSPLFSHFFQKKNLLSLVQYVPFQKQNQIFSFFSPTQTETHRHITEGEGRKEGRMDRKPALLPHK